MSENQKGEPLDNSASFRELDTFMKSNASGELNGQENTETAKKAPA
jgi:hypothetical protein